MLSLFSCWHFFTSVHISDISAVFTSSPTHPFLSCSIYLSFSLCNCSGAVQGLLVCAPAGQISIDLPRRHSWPSLHQTLVKMPAIITLASPAKVMAYIYLTHSLPPIGCEIYLSMCVCNEIIMCVCVCVGLYLLTDPLWGLYEFSAQVYNNSYLISIWQSTSISLRILIDLAVYLIFRFTDHLMQIIDIKSSWFALLCEVQLK